MRFYLPTLLAIILGVSFFSGCSKQPEPAPKVLIDPTLPTPLLNGHISDLNAIAFEWKSIEDPRVEGYYVYRSNPKSGNAKLERHDTVKGRYATHYVDTSLKPNQKFSYRFSSFNAAGIESQASKTYEAGTMAPMPSVSFFASIGDMPRSAKLIWRPHTDFRVSSYNIERKLRDEKKWQPIATIQGRLNAEFIDSDLKDGEVYQYRLLAQTYDQIESLPSEIVTVATKPLPEPIQNIQTTQNLPKKIRISWDASNCENLNHYNIYRSLSPNGPFTYYVKLKETVFNDRISEDGTMYYYQVTAVDDDNLESKRPTGVYMGMSLAKPATPQNVRGILDNHTVYLSWSKGNSGIASYTVVKTKKSGWFDKSVTTFKNIKDTRFSDTEILNNTSYTYQVVSVSQDGIQSELSDPVDISIEAK